MRLRLLDFIRCPSCKGDLALAGAAPAADAPVETGALRCAGCGAEFPIRDGIPRLAPGAPEGDQAEATRDSFSWEWTRYPGALPEDEPIYLEETQFEKGFPAGKVGLDAGCGMGRYTRVARRLGAEMVAVDLSEAVQRLVEDQRADAKLHVIQADLLNPPFKDAVFDFATSQGVLHHTADTKKAFFNVARAVKPGGRCSVWLYGMAGRWSDFKTNPLKPERRGLERIKLLVWLTVGLRHWISDTVRFFTTRTPPVVAHVLSHPLTWIGALPGLKYLTFSVHPDYRIRFFENFDWISPPYQWHHTKEELLDWFREAGFEDLKVLPHGFVPKPGVRGTKRA